MSKSDILWTVTVSRIEAVCGELRAGESIVPSQV